MSFGDEGGDIISNWLVQLLAVLAVIAFIGHEVVSIAVAHLALDEDGREIATAARAAYGSGRDAEAAIEAGIGAAEERGVEVVGVLEVEEPPELVFELERGASTLLLHRIGPLEGMTTVRDDRHVSLLGR